MSLPFICSGCELCSLLQAQAFGQGADSWYLRRCSSCWQQHAKLYTQQAICYSSKQQQEHSNSLPKPRQQHHSSHVVVQDSQQSNQQRARASHFCNTCAPKGSVTETASSSQLISALDLAAGQPELSAPLAAGAKAAAGQSRSSRFSRRSFFTSNRTCCPATIHPRSSFVPAVVLAPQGLQPAVAHQQEAEAGADVCAEQRTKLQWEVSAGQAVSQALAAAGLPATSWVSGAGPRQAADIIKVAAAATAAAASLGDGLAVNTAGPNAVAAQYRQRSASAGLSPPDNADASNVPGLLLQSPSTTTSNIEQQGKTFPQPIAPDSRPAGAVTSCCTPRSAERNSNSRRDVLSNSSSGCSIRRPGSAPCATQPLAGWQAKLGELEAACWQAEQLMLQAPTRAQRSAALDLAVELREDVARIQQANRLQLKMQRTAQLRQGVPPAVLGAAAAAAAAAAEAACTRDGDEGSGPMAAGREHAVSPGTAAAERSHVLRMLKHPGRQLQQLRQVPHNNAGKTAGGGSDSRRDGYEALKQLPINSWRQRRQQEAAWQVAMRQELAALQAEARSMQL
ncbi:hypothetical protein COO60DRAFT_518571 [Scenedesmus sp. NREL 46B-D3]|nr:hypothetical protein COO60DRAFT_518571 [Scenedesmus sp. NREL 46B-D3]